MSRPKKHLRVAAEGESEDHAACNILINSNLFKDPYKLTCVMCMRMQRRIDLVDGLVQPRRLSSQKITEQISL